MKYLLFLAMASALCAQETRREQTNRAPGDQNPNSDKVPDGCRTSCAKSWCGDGVVDSNEECDDGNRNNDVEAGACRTNCSGRVAGGPDGGTPSVDAGVTTDGGSSAIDAGVPVEEMPQAVQSAKCGCTSTAAQDWALLALGLAVLRRRLPRLFGLR